MKDIKEIIENLNFAGSKYARCDMSKGQLDSLLSIIDFYLVRVGQDFDIFIHQEDFGKVCLTPRDYVGSIQDVFKQIHEYDLLWREVEIPFIEFISYHNIIAKFTGLISYEEFTHSFPEAFV